MQAQQLLNSRAIFLAGGGLYLALLAAWAPSGILTDIFSAFQSSSGFPEACSVAKVARLPPVWQDAECFQVLCRCPGLLRFLPELM